MYTMDYDKISCSGKFVAEAIGDEFKRWNSWKPVFIDAPTGSGKNTFIFDTLAPYAKSINKNILLLSNRIALSRQEKRAIWEKSYNTPISDQQLDEKIIFDNNKNNILIISYQSVLNLLGYVRSPPCNQCRQNWQCRQSWQCESYKQFNQIEQFISNINYVIFDEAHYFLADALFNNETDKQLSDTIDYFSSRTRIYMSATAEYIIPVIREQEELSLYRHLLSTCDPRLYNEILGYHNPKLIIYKFPRDYSDYSFHFFKDWKTLCAHLIQSPQEEKWLIFVNSRAEYDDIVKILKDNSSINDNDITFLSADDKNESSYQLISRKEKIKVRILVSTIVLDNGINIRDNQLKHIVINSWDPVSMVQMAGRKRRSVNETVNLYFKTVVEEDDLDRYRTSTNQSLNHIRSFKLNPSYFSNYIWGSLDKDVQKFFRLSPAPYPQQGQILVLNTFAEKRLEYNLGILEKLAIDVYDDEEYGFARNVLEWFDRDPDKESLPEMQLENLNLPPLKDKVKEEVISDLTSYIKSNIEENHIFHADDHKALITYFVGLYKTIPQRNQSFPIDVKRTVKIITSILKELNIPYTFEKIKEEGSQQNGRWRFLEIQSASAEDAKEQEQ